MEIQTLFLLSMLALEPSKIDTATTIRAYDSKAQYGQIFEEYAKKHISSDYQKIAGNIGYLASVVSNRQLAIGWTF